MYIYHEQKKHKQLIYSSRRWIGEQKNRQFWQKDNLKQRYVVHDDYKKNGEYSLSINFDLLI